MFKLAPLPYHYADLEPTVSAAALRFHHDKHHRAYVEKLNELIEKKGLGAASLDDLVLHSAGDVFNNAAQAWNHDFFWHSLIPIAEAGPPHNLAAALGATFGSVAEFKKRFSAVGLSQFGAGWVWLVLGAAGGLEVVSTSNADNPLRRKQTPLLVCDVWEHAYYLDYKHDRAKFLASFWAIVNWQEVARRLEVTEEGIAGVSRSNRAARSI